MVQNTGAGQGGFEPAEQSGGGIEAQIKEGIAAFMQSQDPAIAVEVVKMLAAQMGMAPEVDPYAEPQGAPMGAGVPAQGGAEGMPMGKNGMKIYAKGGKILKFKRK